MIVDEHGHICNFKGYYGGIDPIFTSRSKVCTINLKESTMSKFKVGDIVRVTHIKYPMERGKITIASPANSGGMYCVQNLVGSNAEDWYYSHDITLIESINNNNNMNIKEKFVLALTPEPQKSFRKAGITDGDDILTEDGKSIFLSWLLNTKYAEEFKKEIVDSMKEEKCCK